MDKIKLCVVNSIVQTFFQPTTIFT